MMLRRLEGQGQGKPAELRIIGDGPERARLEKLIRELDLENEVRLLNWMTQDGLFREMSECDVFLFPSLRDGGGLVVVEAMAAGKPVVCLNLAGPGLHVTEACGEGGGPVAAPDHSGPRRRTRQTLC